MNKTLIFIITLFFLSCNQKNQLVKISSVKKPNIILIFMDDLGY